MTIKAQTDSEQSESFAPRLVQVQKRRGKIERVRPEDGPPVVELYLMDNERVISLDLSEDWWYGDRKTRDWSWTAYIEARL